MKVIVNNIKTLNEAYETIVNGADGIGIEISKELNFDKAKDIIFYLPPIGASILITGNVTPMTIINEAKNLNVNTIIFEGNILTDDIEMVREKLPYIKLIKSLYVNDRHSLKQAEIYKKNVDAILLDTDIMNVDNLKICLKIIEDCDYVLFKAKITKDYLAVIKQLNPYGIIISYNPKDKIKEFIKAVK
jgi:phosphoribosylanthranilate isomerase